MKHCQIVDFIFLISIIYLFIWLHQVLIVACAIFSASCGIILWGPWTLVVAYGLSTCGAPA